MPQNGPMLRRIALLIALAISVPAKAGTVSRLYDFQAGTPAEADKVDAEFDNIISTINGNISSVNLAQNAVATGNIASYSVTQAKLGAKGQQISSSSGLFQTFNQNDALIFNATGTLTVVSRPVFVGLMSAGGNASPGRVTYRHNGGGATDNAAYIMFNRDSATQNMTAIGARSITSSTDDILEQLPCSAFWFIDVPSAGSRTYTAAARVATSDSGVVTVENCKLIIYEL